MVTKPRPRKYEKSLKNFGSMTVQTYAHYFLFDTLLSKKFFLYNGSLNFWIIFVLFRHWSNLSISEVSRKSLCDFPFISRDVSKSGCFEGFVERSPNFITKSHMNFCEKICAESLDQVLKHMENFQDFREPFSRTAPGV